MAIIPDNVPSNAHPSFCDPRFCVEHSDHDLDHRSAPTSWEVGADEVVVHVGLSQLEERGTITNRAPVRGILSLEHLELCRTVECDLSSADARMLSAALSVAVERLDAVARLAEVLR